MKKFLGLGLVMLVFASCSDDDSSSNNNNQNPDPDPSTIDINHLEKKWYPVSTIANGITIPYDDHEECGYDYVEFADGGVFKEGDIWDCELWEDVGTYTVDGNDITTNIDGYIEEVTITKLTATEFVVEGHVPAEDGFPAMDVTLNFVSSME